MNVEGREIEGKRRSTLAGLAAALLLLGAVLLFHWRGLQPGYAFLPVDLGQVLAPWHIDNPGATVYNPVVGDGLYEHYPFLTFVTRELQAGRAPLWDPSILMGHPAFADPVYQVSYPIWQGIALAIGDVARTFTLGIGAHVLIGAGLMYALSRTLGHTRAGALVATLTYALGGFMVTWLEMLIWPATLAWLPGILLGYEKSVQQRSLRWVLFAAVAYGLSWLGGQVQAALFFSLLWGTYALGRFVQARMATQRWDWFPLLSLTVSATLGLMLAAPLLLPFGEFLELSRRAVSQGAFDPLPAAQLATLLVPDYFGNPIKGGYRGAFNYSEFTVYAGVVALTLALAAPLVSRRFVTLWLAAASGVALYVLLGAPGVALLKEMPIFKYLNLARIIFILPFFVGLLAAETLSAPKVPRWTVPLAGGAVLLTLALLVAGDVGGIRAYLESDREELGRAVILIVISHALFTLGTARVGWRPLWQWGVAILVFIDLYVWGAAYNPAGRIDEVVPVTPSIEWLQQFDDSYRTVAIQYDGFVFGHNLLSLYGISQPGGYSSVVYRPVQQVIAAGDPQNAFGESRESNWQLFTQPSQRLLEVMHTGRVASLYPIETDDDEPKPPLLNDDWDDNRVEPLYLYEAENPLPRAMVVYQSEVVEAQEAAVARLMNETFPIREAVIVAAPLPFANQPLPATEARITEYRAGQVVLTVETAADGLLVLGDVNYPGWAATVNGEAAQVVTANVVWRGVVVPPGASEVVFTFEPPLYRLGQVLALAALVTGAVLFLVEWRRGQKSRATP